MNFYSILLYRIANKLACPDMLHSEISICHLERLLSTQERDALRMMI